MAEIALRVRLIDGDRLDVTYSDAGTDRPAALIERVITALADDSGTLRTSQDNRLVVLYARGVAAIEFEPQGPAG